MRRYPFRFHSRRAWFVTSGAIFIIVIALVWQQFFHTHSKFIPTTGGIFTGSTIGTVKNLNPLATNSSLFDEDLKQLIFAGLLRYNPVSGQIEDSLANFRISEDSKTYFLTLKNSAYFQDGTPVTINDVIFTFEKVIQNPNFSNTILRDAFEYVSIDTVDEKTLAFILPEQNVFFLSLLTTPILPAKKFENALIEEVTDPDFPFNKHPLGAGPYQLKNIVPNNDGSFRVFLSKNKYFHGGTPLLDQLVFYVYPEFTHLDISHPWTTMFSKIPAVWLDKFEKKLFDQLQLETEYQKREYLLPRFTALFFNLDRESINNPGLRKALRLSLDKEKILEKESGWKQTDSFFFFEGVESWHVPDFAEARRTLRDNGFPYNTSTETRFSKNTGEALELELITSTSPPVYSRFAQNIARNWEKELGLKIEVKVLTPEEFQEALKNREYDLVLFGQNFSKNFDSLSTWHSSQAEKFNLSNLTNEDTDFLIDEVRFSGAQSDLFALSEELDDILPAIILATPTYNLFVSNELQGFSDTFGKIRSHAQRLSGIEKWYFYEKLTWDWPEDKSKLWGFVKWIFGFDTPSPSTNHEETS
ncbi:ABC transporter substrate-binding protein [Candidatus Gracilibacteria bacterium]|nr:ABC transporter substrate-binding protein [Candidatus Gracilibacteria bacterium]